MMDDGGSPALRAAVFYLWPLVLIGDLGSAPVSAIQLEAEVFRRTLRQGIAVKVLREGIFVFDFSNWPTSAKPEYRGVAALDAGVDRVVARVSVMNAYLTCFYSAFYRLQQVITHVMRVHASSLLTFESLDDPVLGQMVAGCPDVFVSAARSDPNWRRARRFVTVGIETMEESFLQFERVLDEKRTDIVALADLYLYSCVAFSEHDYGLALITAWATTEKMLTLMWHEYLNENRERQDGIASVPFISKKRLEKLKGRDFTASIVSEVLSLNGRLPLPLYHGISEARKARNDWVHDLKPTARHTALAAIRVAAEIFELLFSFRVQTQFVTGIPG